MGIVPGEVDKRALLRSAEQVEHSEYRHIMEGNGSMAEDESESQEETDGRAEVIAMTNKRHDAERDAIYGRVRDRAEEIYVEKYNDAADIHVSPLIESVAKALIEEILAAFMADPGFRPEESK
jgi:hypothetical protein